MSFLPPKLRCREIVEADLPAVATLLHHGFPRRSRQFWLRALDQLTRREPPPGLPKYGHLIENDEVPVGVLLEICSTIREDRSDVIRCNLSSWYVEPKFRTYARLLHAAACRQEDITYLNVSPSPHTLPIIEMLGFTRYCEGAFVAVPMLSGLFSGERVKVLVANQKPAIAFDAYEQRLLREHAAYGCISIWCVTAERAYPFIFRHRLVRRIIPCVQLIYCHKMADFVRFAGPIGRFFALRGRPFMIVDANGSVPELVGVYSHRMPPKYFKGPQRPRLGNLAYTEYALWGV